MAAICNNNRRWRWCPWSRHWPCSVEEDLSTKKKPHSWNSNVNVIYVDQPLFTGFSYGKIPDDYDSSMDDASENLYWFLQGFFTKHPSLRRRSRYLVGEGESGRFIPVAAYAITKNNQQLTPSNTTFKINLQGVLIGNGLTTPTIQYRHYVDIVRNNTYNITCDKVIRNAQLHQSKCLDYIDQCQTDKGSCLDASFHCHQDLDVVFTNASRSKLDIRQNCTNSIPQNCCPTPQVNAFLNSPSVRKYLNVRQGSPWARCNHNVSRNVAYAGDVMKDRQRYLGRLLDTTDLRVLIYAGDADAEFNLHGVDAWTQQLQWNHQSEFGGGTGSHFSTSDGTVAGTSRAYGSKFAFVRVFNAGH